MNIKIVKQEGKYYASISGYSETINRYYIKKSWDLAVPERKDFNKNLLQNDIDLYENDVNLFDAFIELEPLSQVKHYYTIVLVSKSGLEYPFHIDYAKFYNVENEDSVYFYKLEKEKFFDVENKRYDFYIKGIYGDEHKLKLISMKSETEVFLKIPKKEILESEVYDIIIDENGSRMLRGRFPLYKYDKVDFAVSSVDCNEYYKFIVTPKFNYSSLYEVKVFVNDKMVRNVSRVENNNDTIKNIIFYLPSDGYKKTTDFKIEYTLRENRVNQEDVTKTTIIKYNSHEKDELEIYGFKYEYSHIEDTCKITWNNKYNKKIVYKVYIGDEQFIINKGFLTINDFKNFNNNNKNIPITIVCDTVDNNVSNTKYTYKDNITNFNFIDSSSNFTPSIDYSDAIYCDKPTGAITWTTPKFRHTSFVSVKALFIKPFLDEYCKPWLDRTILDDNCESFDEQYLDYNEKIVYDFDDGVERLKSVNESIISYDLTEDGFVIATTGNKFDIPLWFCDSSSEYEVTVKIYDLFGNFVGENTSAFKTMERVPKELTEKYINFERRQLLQFGETGTVGEFYKIESPRPIDVRNHYESTFKTFLGKELNDMTNVDFDGNSLFYYFNTNEGNSLRLRYQRSYNFYGVETEVLYGSSVVFPKTIHKPRGNSYDDNIIDFPKNQFNKEGKYTMKIKTFNSTGQSSKVKELNFFVHNTAPEKPFVKIKSSDHYHDGANTVINKKYFEIEVTNNAQSDKYAGWKFKETHFYFRPEDSSYSSYADYVIQTNVNDGSIVLRNTVPIENGKYECKVINYDYAGNASEAEIFKFELKSEIKVTPQSLYSNKPNNKFKWYIEKAQDSEGIVFFFRYSYDGINFEDYDVTKLESPYYVGDNTTKKELEIESNWISLDDKKYREGFYQLVCYEFNKKYPEGQPEYEFTSKVVEVNNLSNPSNPIYSKPITGKVEVFNRKAYNEWSYANDLNDLVFESIHNEMVFDNPDTPYVEGQYYKLEVVEPGGKNHYGCTLELPTEIGVFTFTNIAEQCGISSQKEGVWEIRYITIDKYGNDNTYRGYFTYHVNIVKRSPSIQSATITNGTGSKYFGLYSDKIGFYMNSSQIYENIDNYDEFKYMFEITKYEVKFTETPFNSQYTINAKIDDDGSISVMNKLTESDKVSHSKDGRYSVLISAIDPLNRKSDSVSRLFNISTTTNSEINFVNNTVFNSKEVTLNAIADENVYRIYYLANEMTFDKPEFDREEIITTWKQVAAGNIILKEQELFGVSINNTYTEDGYKNIYYVIEEQSGNLSEIKTYLFKVDTKTMLIPIFDLYNKVYFDTSDRDVYISWNATNDSVKTFNVKLDKVQINNDGEIEIVDSYAIAIDNVNLLTPVGAGNNSFISIGAEKSFSFGLELNTQITIGQYMITVSGENLYGTTEENYFLFQIDSTSLSDISFEIQNNKITLDSNLITWEHIRSASYYEVSYDCKSWIKTLENMFYINTDLLVKDSNGEMFVYIRWKSKTGIYSQPSKIKLNMNIIKIKDPVVEFFDNETTENNRMLKWKVIVDNPENVDGIYYSFNKTKWHYAKVTGRENWIINNDVEYPVEDGVYDIFVILTDDDPSNTQFYNKSSMVHSFVKIFNKPIESVEFLNIKNGNHLSAPTRLFIANKDKDVKYFIIVNDINVEEGYEISSSTLKRFNIEVKAKKDGIEKIYDVINKDSQFHVWSLTTESYILNVNNSKIIAKVNDTSAEIEIESMPDIKNNQVILYREKKPGTKWATLRTGDTLSLLTEWEFHITTFSVV